MIVYAIACTSGPASSPATVAGQVPGEPSATPTAQLPTSTPVPTIPEVPTAIPVDISTPVPTAVPVEEPDRKFDAFVEKVKNGQAEKIVGVYVQGVLALPVIQQPMDSKGMPTDPGFVSIHDEEATQFLYAYIFADGNIGLLAHNYLAGRYFFMLKEGDLVELIYGDGHVDEYVIGKLEQYQALSPRSQNSNFVDLVTGETITATELFYRVYGGEKRVTFQTCINRDNDTEWGRFFPIAFPGE